MHALEAALCSFISRYQHPYLAPYQFFSLFYQPTPNFEDFPVFALFDLALMDGFAIT